MNNFIRFLAPCQHLEKTNTVPRKHLVRWKDGRMEEPTDPIS